MSWEKSVFSNLMWVTYTLITGLAIVELSAVAVNYFRGPVYMGPVLALVIMALVALFVFLFHRWSPEHKKTVQGGVSRLLVGEAIFVVMFLILGLVLRMDGVDGVREAGGYYEAAKVAEDRSVLEFVHGAVYLYLQLLHTVFVLLGNKLAAGIWLQVILQLLAILILYFGVRKLAGVLPAIIMLLFFTCSGTAIQGALTLSPEPLYLLLFAIGLNMLAACSGEVISPALFLLVGIWIGLIGYLDISGFLLLFFGIAIILAVREKKITATVRIVAFILHVGGILIGFFEAILADAYISGKGFDSVLNVWWALYRPRDYGFSSVGLSDELLWAGPLFIIMCFGIFSYWYNREIECISMWMFIICITAAAQNLGMLTEELPSGMYLMMNMTVLAGVGIKACFSSQVNIETHVKVEAVPVGILERTEGQLEKLDSEFKKGKAKKQTQKKIRKQPQAQEQLQLQEQELALEQALEQVQAQEQVQEPLVERVDEQTEESDMGISEVDGVKLPKYLREPGTDQVKIPKYMQEEAERAKPKQQAKAPEPVKPDPKPQEEISSTEEPEAVKHEIPVDSANNVQGAAEQSEREEVQSDPQAMYGVPEIFRKQGEQKPQEISKQQQPEPQETSKQQQPEPEVKELAPKQEESGTSSKPNYIENPLPLPKPHQKKVLGYNVEPSGYDDDFDHPVDENDDFDIQ